MSNLTKEEFERLRVKPTLGSHNMARTRPYVIWEGMKRRCLKPKCKSYPAYGGRGIKICNKWLAFAGFWDDMQEGYQANLSIDRIDNNGDYEKTNCRWATSKQQNNNHRPQTRGMQLETPQGVMTMSEVARHYDLGYGVLVYRVKRGWTGNRLVQPVGPQNKIKL